MKMSTVYVKYPPQNMYLIHFTLESMVHGEFPREPERKERMEAGFCAYQSPGPAPPGGRGGM